MFRRPTEGARRARRTNTKGFRYTALGDLHAAALLRTALIGARASVAQYPAVGAPDRDLYLVLDPEGVGVPLWVKHRSLVTDNVPERLLADALLMNAALLVVADRVTDAARKALTSRSGGYLDLQGRLDLASTAW